jgi:hypothetical protein
MRVDFNARVLRKTLCMSDNRRKTFIAITKQLSFDYCLSAQFCIKLTLSNRIIVITCFMILLFLASKHHQASQRERERLTVLINENAFLSSNYSFSTSQSAFEIALKPSNRELSQFTTRLVLKFPIFGKHSSINVRTKVYLRKVHICNPKPKPYAYVNITCK